jgi:hypothetical protein
MSSKVSFVGAGPGAADLITIRGARLLRHADVIIFAGSLVDRKLVERYATTADVYDSAGMTLSEVITVMMDAIVADRNVVRLHTGDPAIYGAIQEQMMALDQLGVEYEVVPGVTSAFAAGLSPGTLVTLLNSGKVKHEFTASKFFGSRAFTVSVVPSGPLIVTVCAFLSMPTMVAVTLICRPTAPAGGSPGFEVARPCWTVAPGVAGPGFFTSKASAS